MKIKIYITFLVMFSFSKIIGQENEISDNFSYEFGVKSVFVKYTPIEYNREEELTDFGSIPLRNNISNNNTNFQPIFFNIYNKKDMYEIQASYQNLSIHNAGFNRLFINPTRSYSFGKRYLKNTDRTDYKINYLKDILENKPKVLKLGLGVRKIDRFTNDESGIYFFEEKFSTQGVQFVINNEINIFHNLYLKTSLEYYLTYGNRDIKESSAFRVNTNLGSKSLFWGIDSRNSTRAIFQGYEFDIALNYKFDNKINLFFGYLSNKSNFSYRNYRDISYSISDFNDYNTIHFLQMGRGGVDLFEGYYFGASLKN